MIAVVSRYPHLFSPLTISGIPLRNRVMMGSMHTGLEDRRRDYPKLAAYFAERARGGVGLIVTGGIAPNRSGWIAPFAGKLSARREVARHRLVTDAVHGEGGRIALQILHAGRYGYHPLIVAPSKLRAPINRFTPRELSASGVRRQVDDFVRCAELAREAGYDGVEIMGSEGYLINQFLVERTNRRDDEWGGTRERRARFALEIVRRTRERAGQPFMLIFRVSGLDLVAGGGTLDDLVWLMGQLEAAGVSLIDTGIGWHEARVPTIAGVVPRAAFSWVTSAIKSMTRLPVAATNRINDPVVAERLLASGMADLISMARPMLADPHWTNKAAAGLEDEINTCIACNQSCLDRVFKGKRASCLVNPRAGYETELVLVPVTAPRHIAVVGAGPAGLACAVSAAERGHRVTLFERNPEIGGQFCYAREVPGKEEFFETLRYFRARIEKLGVELRLGITADATMLRSAGFDAIVLASGVRARIPAIPGSDHPKAIPYPELLSGRRVAGSSVAIIGAGGIGFDVATYLTAPRAASYEVAVASFTAEWGIDREMRNPGGLAVPEPSTHGRKVWLLQRTQGRPGRTLGATTGWIHRRALEHRGVQMRGGLTYDRIDEAGLHLRSEAGAEVLAVDSVILCAGQEPVTELAAPLAEGQAEVHVIGGARLASELDAERAIREGTELAARL